MSARTAKAMDRTSVTTKPMRIWRVRRSAAVLAPRPGRVKAIHEVPLPRERDGSTRLTPEFTEFAGLLRSELE